jgi:hypothetical protein
VVFNDLTEKGTVRCLKLRWKAPLRASWGGKGPILHLDATLHPDIVTHFIPDITVEAPVDGERAACPYPPDPGCPDQRQGVDAK